MWHEARKQEKKIKEVMVNYKKRAERRREHYDKLKGDPFQLLRINGSKCKLHLDPKTSSTLGSMMIPWQGDNTNIISQYDVRIHMDYIPDYSKTSEVKLSKEVKYEEARCSYESYRTLVQNSFHKLSEGDALTKIETEEMYYEPVRRPGKKKSKGGAAIGYTYGDEDPEAQQLHDENLLAAYLGEGEGEKEENEDHEYEIDMDVDSFKPYEIDRMNVLALDFGLQAGAFSRFLRAEKAALLEQKLAKISEMEKNALSGRKSRRERRNWKDNQASVPRLPTPPSYAQRDSPTYKDPDDGRDQSSSRSSSPECEGKVEFITEFGGGSDTETKEKPVMEQSPAKPSKSGHKGSTKAADGDHADRKSHASGIKRARSRSHDRDRSYDRRSRDRDRSYERRSRDRDRSYDRRSRDRDRSYNRRSRDRDRYEKRSRDRDRSYDRRSRDRNRSYDTRDHRERERDSRSGKSTYHSHYRYHSPARSRTTGNHHKRDSYSRSRSRDRYHSSRKYSHRSYSRSRSRDRVRSRDWERDTDRGRLRGEERRDRERRYQSRSYSRSNSRSPDRTQTKSRRDSQSHSSSSSSERSLSPPTKRKRSSSRSQSPAEESTSHFDTKRSPSPLVKTDESAEMKKVEIPVKPQPPAPVVKNKTSHKDRMMKKMQSLLNKQHKIDRKAQKNKEKIKKAERKEREEEMRERQQRAKEEVKDGPNESDYTFSGAAETYQGNEPAAEDSDSDSSFPDSPHRLLTQGFSGDTKSNDFYYGRFS